MTQIQSQSSESQHNITERKKSNLAFAFFCMDKDRAKDMEIYYAFCRLMDDIADEEVKPVLERKNELLSWKEEIRKIYSGETSNLTPLAEEMKGVIERRNIPQQYLQDLIDGVLTDTEQQTFETFEQVKKYCYGVASAVGLVSIYIFGFKNERTKLFAEALGYALQFTNILRDVVDDITSHNRVYIPTEELNAFGVSRDDLLEPKKNPNCKKLFQFMYFRAKHFFNKARRLIAEEDRIALTPAFIMWNIYEKILDTLKERNFDITAKPLKISKLKKIRLALHAIRDAKKTHKQNDFFGKATVVGGGIAGITMATRLLWEGFDVEMFEARNSLGGRIAKISSFGASLDNAQHAAMGCYDNFFKTIELLGNNPNDYFKKVDGMDFIYTDKSIVPVKYPNGVLKKAFSALSYSKLKGFANARNIALLLSIKIGLLPNETETAEEFLTRKQIPQKAIESFWSPLCVSSLNTSIEKANARLMAITLKKSILKGFESAILYLPKKPIQSAFEVFNTYMKGCGSKIFFAEPVKKISFENSKIASISTTKGDYPVKYLFSAVGIKALQNLLPRNFQSSNKLAKIAVSSITNIYFTCPQKLITGNYACLIGSPLHWIFDHTDKLPTNNSSLNLYSLTLSDHTEQMSKEKARSFLEIELKKLFGEVDLIDVLPSSFSDATISADTQSEKARPTQNEIQNEIPNLFVVGDFIQSGLPCTMESAAKSAFDINLRR